MKELKRLIRPDELAKALGVAQVTVYSWCRRGVIPHLKLEGVVRFDPDEVAEWLRECQISARKLYESHGDLTTDQRKEKGRKGIADQQQNPGGGRPSGRKEKKNAS
jgi:excisionase family DNA binding protein